MGGKGALPEKDGSRCESAAHAPLCHQGPEQDESQQATPTPHWRATVRTVAALTTVALVIHSLTPFLSQGLGAVATWNTSPHEPNPPVPDDARVRRPFRWSHIAPSRQLKYHDCYDGLQCARLDLPLDHHAPDAPDRIALAVTRRPAKVAVTDVRYGGAVLLNPGGPGGSGVALQVSHGEYFQRIVDSAVPVSEASETDKYFDIIGFDPRGVNHSTPILTCFPDSFARQTWNIQLQAEGLLGSSAGSLRTAWRRARALADGCSRRLESANATNFLEHVNTTPGAADMLAIVERHGQWREQEAARRHRRHPDTDTAGPAAAAVMLRRTRWRQGAEQLQYWGFSYGTVLGATFAAMYPDRVSRMALDGVVDADDYYNGPWLGNLRDTDRILDQIFHYCADAGPDLCALWQPGGVAAIRAAHEKLLHDIWDDPLSVVGNRRRGPEIITWTDLKLVVKNALYQPVTLGPIMTELLHDVTNGSGSLFADYKQRARTPVCQSAQCKIDGPFSEECVTPEWNELEATSAVLCTDAEGIGRLTEDEFRTYWGTLQRQSRSMGDYWAHTRLSCAGWRSRAKWRYIGPFAGRTAHPILWVSNTFDTVTPLQNARRMSARFPGSVLLQQHAEGHCSFTAPSLCTAKAIRRYFQTGRLPAAGTRCLTDVKPFQGPTPGLAATMSQGDRVLWDALHQLAEIRSLTPL